MNGKFASSAATRHRVSARRRRQRGSSLVESSLSLMAFLFLTIGLMEFSMAVYAYNFVTFAANDAARYASMHGSHSPTPVSDSYPLQTLIRNEAVALIKSRVWVTGTWTPNNNPGSTVKVNVQYRVVPLAHLVMKNDLWLSSTSTMVILN